VFAAESWDRFLTSVRSVHLDVELAVSPRDHAIGGVCHAATWHEFRWKTPPNLRVRQVNLLPSFGFSDQALQHGDLTEEFLARLGGAAQQQRTRRRIGDDPCLRADLRALTDAQMSSHCSLAADLNEILQYCGTGDPNLCDDDAATSQTDIVSDLNQIIEPRAGTDDGVMRGSSVDGGIGANLHIVSDDDAAELRDTQKSRFGGGEAEAFLANPSAWVDVNACTQQGVAQAGMGADPAIGTNCYTAANRYERTDATARADLSTSFDDDVGTDFGRCIDARGVSDNGREVNAWTRRWHGME
jgi:hypothetical protein